MQHNIKTQSKILEKYRNKRNNTDFGKVKEYIAELLKLKQKHHELLNKLKVIAGAPKGKASLI